MKKFLVFSLLGIGLTHSMYAQNVSITPDGKKPDPSAMLDIQANDKGILIPRLNSMQRLSIASPANGLLVYDTDSVNFFFYTGLTWKNLGSGTVPISNVQLTEIEVDRYVSNNGYLTSFTEVDGDITNELQSLRLSNDTIYLSDGGSVKLPSGSVDTKLTESEVDAFVANNGYLTSFTEVDGDITNELQSLRLSNDTIYLSDGGSVKLPSGSVDTKLTESEVDAFVANNGYLTSFTEVDGDITNELQSLRLSNDTIYLSDGGSVKLPSGSVDTKLTESEVDAFVANNGYLTSFTEVDGDITNELQSLRLSNDTIYLSDGGSVKLPSGSVDTKLTESEVDAFVANNGYLTSFTEVDGDITNELQSLRLSNDTIYLSDGGSVKLPSGSVDTKLTESEVDAFVANNGYLTSFTEVDGDITNELQSLRLSNDTIYLSDGGSVKLPSGSVDTKLTESEVDAFVANNGYLTSFTEVDGSISNEIQDLTLVGNSLKITNNGAATEIDLSPYLDDTDTDKQTLSITGTELSISNGNKVDLVDLTAGSSGEFLSDGNVVHNTTNLTSDDFVFGSIQLEDVNGPTDDSRFYFDKSTSAFRSGWAGATQWDELFVGQYSFAGGADNIADGIGSVAFGANNTATGDNAMAIGQSNHAIGVSSVAFGNTVATNGDLSFAFGSNNTAQGNNSFAGGDQSIATGNYSFSMGLNTSSNKDYSVAFGERTVAEGTGSFSTGTQSEATGEYSVAQGEESAANGYASVAMGIKANAGGMVSVAMGNEVTTTGMYSVAMGNLANSTGESSISMGDRTLAAENYAVAFGTQTIASQEGAFAVGSESEASGYYAVAMGDNGNASGYASVALGQKTVAEGMLSFASGGETRAIGSYSFSTGNATHAEGDYSFAGGQNSSAFKDFSVALGNQTLSDGEASFSMGVQTIARGKASIAFGESTEASGYGAVTMGQNTVAEGSDAFALGYNSRAIGDFSFAGGESSNAEGSNSFVFGQNSVAYGNSAIAFGVNAFASSYGEVCIGLNPTQVPGSQASFVGTDRVFTVGNGTSSSSTNDALVILKNGGVGIGTSEPEQGLLEINGEVNGQSIYASDEISATKFNVISDQRVKNIQGHSNSANDLKTIAQIHITDYTFIDTLGRGNSPFKKVIAQQVKEVFPQAVKDNGKQFIPDIYTNSTITNGRIDLDTDLKQGDRVKLFFDLKEQNVTVVEVGANYFVVNTEKEGEVFVFGKEVNDFHSVDYDAISMLNVSATQELLKRIELLEKQKAQQEADFSKELESLNAKLDVLLHTLQAAR